MRNRCDFFERLIVLSLEEMLPARRRVQVGRHLDACPRCRAARAEYLALRGRLADLPPDPLPARLPEIAPPRRAFPAFRLPVQVSFAAALALLVVLTVFLGNRGNRDPGPGPEQAVGTGSTIPEDEAFYRQFVADYTVLIENVPALPEIEDYYLLESFTAEERKLFSEILHFI